ncbi:MAG: hypothetical protein JWQ38_2230 [Flavipsychrobacter sp.]|nr:hypothetical protein [Flavipsychrobacter sp.]
MSDLDNISSFGPGNGGKEKLSDERLMAYFEGKLSSAEQHEVEQWLADEGMESDALEGLRTLQPEETKHTVSKLNHQLRKAIINKKKKRRTLSTDQYTWAAIAIILLLIVLAYIVIKFSLAN